MQFMTFLLRLWRKKPVYAFARTCGSTLVEAVIASFILAVMSLSLLMSITYAGRASTIASMQMTASQFLQGEVESILSDKFENINSTQYPDINSSSARKIYLDRKNQVPLTVNYDILSTFPVTSASSTSVNVTGIPTNAFRSGVFIANELTSNVLVVSDGKGLTQRGAITSNGSNSINFTPIGGSWTLTPDTTSAIQFNMGKVVTVRASWNFRGYDYKEELKTLVVLPADL